MQDTNDHGEQDAASVAGMDEPKLVKKNKEPIVKDSNATDAVRQRLRHFLAAQGISARVLSIQAGFNETYASDILSGKNRGRIRADSLKKLAAALGISLTELLTSDTVEPTSPREIGPHRFVRIGRFRLVQVIYAAETNVVRVEGAPIAFKRREIPCVPYERDPDATIAGAEVRDRAMDRADKPLLLGSYVTIVLFDNNIRPRNGTTVLVQIKNNAGITSIFRQLYSRNGRHELRAQSSESDFPTIHIVDLSTEAASEIRLVGEVYHTQAFLDDHTY